MGYRDMDLDDQVRANLRRNRELAAFRIDVNVRNGIVYLRGHVTPQAREQVLELTRSVQSVAFVVDQMTSQ